MRIEGMNKIANRIKTGFLRLIRFDLMMLNSKWSSVIIGIVSQIQLSPKLIDFLIVIARSVSDVAIPRRLPRSHIGGISQ